MLTDQGSSHDPHPHLITVASLQATLTQVSVQLGRLDERQTAIQASLLHHMQEEHKEFKEALAKVEKVEASVDEIHAAAKTVKIIAAVAAALGGAFAWAIDLFKVRP